MPILTTSVIAPPCARRTRPRARPRRRPRHPLQRLAHAGHHVDPVDRHRPAVEVAQRGVQHRAALGLVDLRRPRTSPRAARPRPPRRTSSISSRAPSSSSCWSWNSRTADRRPGREGGARSGSAANSSRMAPCPTEWPRAPQLVPHHVMLLSGGHSAQCNRGAPAPPAPAPPRAAASPRLDRRRASPPR
jgi:hypothetical protein